jgi:O-antigen biosynthesis protein
MKFTGERFVPEIHGAIELEHLHRYFLAKEIVKDKIVLDIASGEGYGSYILAKTAAKVFGVDISKDAIDHANVKYKTDNLEFITGSCNSIPLANRSVDIVVSYETIEHHDEHDQMMKEIKRVLKPDGCLIISSPDKLEYSDKPEFVNEHHVKELYRNEFENLVKNYFKHYQILGQRMIYGSAIISEGLAVKVSTYQYSKDIEGPFNGIKDALYLVAVASDFATPELSSGLLEQPINDSEIIHFWKDTVANLQSEVGKLRQEVLENQSQIINYVEAVTGRDTDIVNLTAELASANSSYLNRIAKLTGLEVRMAEVTRRLAEREGELVQNTRRKAELEIKMVEISERLAKREGDLAQHTQREKKLNSELAESSKRLAEREGELAQNIQRRAGLEVKMVEISERLAEREGELAQHMQREDRLNAELAESSKRLTEREGDLAQMAQRETGFGGEIAQLQHQIVALHNSSSWRITAPLRFISRHIRRSIPVAKPDLSAFKLRYGVVGTAKKAVGIYRREGLPGIKRGFRLVVRSMELNQTVKSQANTAPLAIYNATVTPELKTADGTWEWRAYTEVKARITDIQIKKADSSIIKPVQIINSEGQKLATLAERINFLQPVPLPKVSIIVPVFNNIHLTIECLLSIANSDCTVCYEIIVADDCSTDDTSGILKLVRHIKYFRNDTNLGFLRNSNKALEYVNGEFVLFLNNDVQVTGQWLSDLLSTFKEFPLAGAVGPKFVYPSGHLQEAGAAFNIDGTAQMIGLNENPNQPRFSYTRRVDYVSGACLLSPAKLIKKLGGFSEDFLPCYCEDSDLCLRIQEQGHYIYCNPNVTVMHHLSKSTDALGLNFKLKCVYRNVTILRTKWQSYLQKIIPPKIIAFYLPQFHPFPENNQWWGHGFTEWTNVAKTKPNFTGHYQPRYPADLGYYDLRLPQVLAQQAALASRYGVGGFCFYYYWFNGNRLLEQPLEQMLKSKEPDFPFCLCWANENWTRRWDGLDHEVLMAQAHSPEDDTAVIKDLIRYFKDDRYIRIDGRPLLLVYRVALFPDFAKTAACWRDICRFAGIGEIYLSSVESFDDVNGSRDPGTFGCDASVEFPPHGMAEAIAPPSPILNAAFKGTVANYNDVAVRFATRPAPPYTRFRSVMPGWDNTARRQDTSFCFDNSTPGAFQAWLEASLEQTHLDRFGDEKLVFLNAWNEWAEGAYMEPDKRFGHTYLEAVRNALDAKQLKR